MVMVVFVGVFCGPRLNKIVLRRICHNRVETSIGDGISERRLLRWSLRK